jgi:hypothetical protein
LRYVALVRSDNHQREALSMTWMEKSLMVLLRLSATTLLLAVVPVLIPHAWMDSIHRGIGLGQLPAMPLIGYLTRSLSALYARHRAIILFVSFDVHCYLPLIRFLAVASGVFAASLLVLDLAWRMAWTDEAGAFRWNSPNCTFWNVTGSEYEDFRARVKTHFLGDI